MVLPENISTLIKSNFKYQQILKRYKHNRRKELFNKICFFFLFFSFLALIIFYSIYVLSIPASASSSTELIYYVESPSTVSNASLEVKDNGTTILCFGDLAYWKIGSSTNWNNKQTAYKSITRCSISSDGQRIATNGFLTTDGGQNWSNYSHDFLKYSSDGDGLSCYMTDCWLNGSNWVGINYYTYAQVGTINNTSAYVSFVQIWQGNYYNSGTKKWNGSNWVDEPIGSLKDINVSENGDYVCGIDFFNNHVYFKKNGIWDAGYFENSHSYSKCKVDDNGYIYLWDDDGTNGNVVIADLNAETPSFVNLIAKTNENINAFDIDVINQKYIVAENGGYIYSVDNSVDTPELPINDELLPDDYVFSYDVIKNTSTIATNQTYLRFYLKEFDFNSDDLTINFNLPNNLISDFENGYLNVPLYDNDNNFKYLLNTSTILINSTNFPTDDISLTLSSSTFADLNATSSVCFYLKVLGQANLNVFLSKTLGVCLYSADLPFGVSNDVYTDTELFAKTKAVWRRKLIFSTFMSIYDGFNQYYLDVQSTPAPDAGMSINVLDTKTDLLDFPDDEVQSLRNLIYDLSSYSIILLFFIYIIWRVKNSFGSQDL